MTSADTATGRPQIRELKQRAGFDAADEDRLASMADVFEQTADEAADAYLSAITRDQTVYERLEQSDLSGEAIRSTVRSFVAGLEGGTYTDADVADRVQFGERCRGAGLPLSAVVAAFDAYDHTIGTRIKRDAHQHLSGEHVAVDSALPRIEDTFEQLRCLDRVRTLDVQAVVSGYRDAGEDEEGIEDSIKEVEQRYLQPVKSSASVVEEASDAVCTQIEEQTDMTAEMSEEITSLSATIEEIAASAEEVERTARTAEEKATDGQSAAEDALAVMEEVETESETVATDIEELEQQASDIDEIIDVINDIADQTNMLALNANIEAARAGQAGEGFAVVADEVKSLAEQSQERAGEIEEMIEEMQTVTARTASNLRQTNDELSDGVEQVEQAMQILEEIVESVTTAAQGVSEIADTTDDQATTAESVAAMVDDVADRSETIQEKIDLVAAANEEQAEKLDQLAEAMADLDG